MKKAIIISSIVVVVLLVVSFVIVGLMNRQDTDNVIDNDDNFDSQYENVSFLRMTDVDEIVALSEELGLTLLRDGDIYIGFEALDVGDFKCSFAYQIENGNIHLVTGTFLSELTLTVGDTSDQAYDALMESINNISTLCEYLFGVPAIDKYNIYANEGYPLELEDKESYLSLLKGEAIFGFYVRDLDGSYWKFYTVIDDSMSENSSTEGATICFCFSRTFDAETTAGWTADLVLE